LTWYAVHVATAIEVEGQMEFPLTVYEDVILIQAASSKVARELAISRAEAEASADSMLKVNGRPAEKKLIGARKIISIFNTDGADQDADRPDSGTEITYSRFEIPNSEELAKYVKGQDVRVTYVE
jgi:hypothetical protein